MKVQKTTTRVQ